MILKRFLLGIFLSSLSLTTHASSVISRDTCMAMDCRVYTLPNGIKVMAKQTTFNPHTVVVRGWSPGGLSMHYGLTSTPALMLLEDFIGEIGCEGYSSHDLKKCSKQERIRTSVKIDKAEETLELSVPTYLLDKGIALLCKRAVSPLVTQAEFDAWQSRRMKIAERQHSAAIQIMGDSILRNVYNHHPLAGKPTLEDVRNVTLPDMMSIIKDRFSDMGDFTFYICGDFQWPDLEPVLVERIGALPTGRRSSSPEKPRYTGYRYPSATKEIHFSVPTNRPLAITYRFHHGDTPYTLRSHTVANLLGQIVIRRISATLKDSLGTVSFVQGHCSVIYPENGIDNPTFLFPIYIRTTPDKILSVEEYVDGVLKEIADKGPDPDEWSLVTAQRADYEAKALVDNGYWLELMLTYDRYGVNFADAPVEITSITPEDMQQFATEILSSPRVTISMNR